MDRPRRFRASLIPLLAANLVPLAGVLFFGWQARDVLLVYWAESAVVGVFNVLKMATCRGDAAGGTASMPGALRFFLIPFFIVHFGVFMFVHGLFIVFLYSGEFGGPPLANDRELLDSLAPVAIGVVALFLSHGFSFVANFLIGGERNSVGLPQLMTRPYARIVVMQVTIIAGAVPVLALGLPAATVAILCVLKTVVDARAHLAERRRTLARPG